MSREEDKQQLLSAIKEAHEHGVLEPEIESILVEAVKGLKRGELPSYVSYRLVRSLSGYFMTHVRQKQDPYVKKVYELANRMQTGYSGFLFY